MNDQNVRIMCPNLTCRKVLIVPSNSRGKTVRCRNCATTVRVPMKRTSEPASPPPSEGEAGKPAAA